MRRLRICLVASCRFPIREPFVGGLESMTAHLARELVRRGHDVTLYAAPGSDPDLGVAELVVEVLPGRRAPGRPDTEPSPGVEMAEHHAYLSLMLDLASGRGGYDVVHNNSLHHLPVAMARAVPAPVLTTLHTPPLWWLESAVRLDHGAGTFVAVSEHTARSWAPVVDCGTILNGVDVSRWPAGPGGGGAVWTGRIVPEKAPHEAIAAARAAGLPLVLAGPVLDEAYFRDHVAPHLHGDVRHVGHLDQRALAALVGAASVAVVTPDWDEPYGLVAAEAMACGTPVAAYDRGGLGELVTPASGRLAPAGDTMALARCLLEARALDRAEVRRHASENLSLERMVDEYELLYLALADRSVAA